MKYLTRSQHVKTYQLSEMFFDIGLSERSRLIKDFVNEHVIIQKGKRRK